MMMVMTMMMTTIMVMIMALHDDDDGDHIMTTSVVVAIMVSAMCFVVSCLNQSALGLFLALLLRCQRRCDMRSEIFKAIGNDLNFVPAA